MTAIDSVTGVARPEWMTDDDCLELAELTKMALAEIGYHVTIQPPENLFAGGRYTFDEKAAPPEAFRRAGVIALDHLARRRGFVRSDQ